MGVVGAVTIGGVNGLPYTDIFVNMNLESTIHWQVNLDEAAVETAPLLSWIL